MSIGDGAGITQTITTAYNTIDSGDTATLNFSSLGITVKVSAIFDTVGLPTDGGGSFETGFLGQSIFQVGNENTADHKISFTLGDMRASGTTGLNANVDVSTQSDAQLALTTIDSAINLLGDRRATIGVTQNRFGFTIANLATSIENITASESIIRDADIAFETVAFTKNQILLQAGTAMLAQANLAPQAVLGVLV
jgi:flagellin